MSPWFYLACASGGCLAYLFYTSGLGMALRCIVMWFLCPRELRGPFTALLSASAQEAGNVKVADQLETTANKISPNWVSVRVELVSKNSIGYGLIGKARDDAKAVD